MWLRGEKKERARELGEKNTKFFFAQRNCGVFLMRLVPVALIKPLGYTLT